MYYVYDCTKETGYTVAVPWYWLACLMIFCLTFLTGKPHDTTL